MKPAKKNITNYKIIILALLITLSSALIKPTQFKTCFSSHVAVGFVQGAVPLLWPLLPHIIQNYHRFYRDTPQKTAFDKRLYIAGFAVGVLMTSSLIARELWLRAIAQHSPETRTQIPPSFLKA